MTTPDPTTAAPVAFTDVVEGCTCDACMEGEPVTDTAAQRDAYSPLHPHEPEVPPTLDDEGRCLTCRALLAAEELGWRRGQAVQTWLLTGDLDSLEFAISDYIWQYGQHLPGVVQETPAGVPTAVANMAMTVIRKNVRRVAGPNG